MERRWGVGSEVPGNVVAAVVLAVVKETVEAVDHSAEEISGRCSVEESSREEVGAIGEEPRRVT